MVHVWEARLGVEVAEVRIRQMKTRWGSCNARARRVCLNLDLIRRPSRCLEYVLVHELVHFFERRHNARFYGFMDELVPDWRACRAEFNRLLTAVHVPRGRSGPQTTLTRPCGPLRARGSHASLLLML